jgi:hypothetical protein
MVAAEEEALLPAGFLVPIIVGLKLILKNKRLHLKEESMIEGML